jgi:hypothetical protein
MNTQDTIGHNDESTGEREDTKMDDVSITDAVAGIIDTAAKLVRVTYPLAQSLTALGNEISSVLGILLALKPSVSAHIDLPGLIASVSTPSSSLTSSSSFPSTSSKSDKDDEILSSGHALSRQILEEIDACKSALIAADQILSFSESTSQPESNPTTLLQQPLNPSDIQSLAAKIKKHRSTLGDLCGQAWRIDDLYNSS